MGLIIKMPMINANDESVELVNWLVNDGTPVRKGDTLCIVETTKSAVDVVADDEGIMRILVAAGAHYAVGHPIGFLAESVDEALPDLSVPPPSALPSATHARWTKKARILADKLGIDLPALAEQHPDVVVGEALVQAAAGARHSPRPTSLAGVAAPRIIEFPSDEYTERVLILGGGGGASLVLDILSRTTNQKAVGILDNNPEMVGRTLMEIPILGSFDLALSLWREGKFDALISTVVRNIDERAEIFEKFSKLGIRFANIVDPAVRVGQEATLGQGNLIIFGSYIATGVTLGNNNFLAAGTFIEHHSIVGSHCTFGPRTSLSGKVSVGDRVKFGAHVAVEPQLEIGTESLIASGVTLTSHVPPRTIVKSSTNPVFRHVK